MDFHIEECLPVNEKLEAAIKFENETIKLLAIEFKKETNPLRRQVLQVALKHTSARRQSYLMQYSK